METKRQKRPAGFGSQQLQQLLVNLVDSRGDIAFGGIGGFLISREKRARHVALVAVHGNSAVDENVLDNYIFVFRSHIARIDQTIVVVVLHELAVRSARNHRGEGNALRASQLDVVFEGGAQTVFDSDH